MDISLGLNIQQPNQEQDSGIQILISQQSLFCKANSGNATRSVGTVVPKEHGKHPISQERPKKAFALANRQSLKIIPLLEGYRRSCLRSAYPVLWFSSSEGCAYFRSSSGTTTNA